jgi:ABC-type glycerol-3-phosphate transport system permease component
MDKGYASAVTVLLPVLLVLYALVLIGMRRRLLIVEPAVMRTGCSPRRMLGGIGFYAAVTAFVVFALFPIYWTLKISVTPSSLLYSEGIITWPSKAMLHNYVSVLAVTNFPRYFLNSIIVSVTTAEL